MKNLKTFLPVLFILFNNSFLLATEKHVLEGRVLDAQTGKGLGGAEIILKGTVLGVTTKHSGFFRMSGIQDSACSIVVSYIGYERFEKHIVFGKQQLLKVDIRLRPAPLNMDNILIEAQKPYSTASSRIIRKLDMRLKPTRSAQDMLQLVPGLIIAQHAGGGKAEQIYMRGFDADHGTDVAIDVDGIPVNMVSHGHGQGYADLHFLIPEVIENFGVFKGPYFTDYGNFATAGAVSFRTKDHLDHNLIQLEGGYFGTAKLTTLLQIPSNDEHQNAYFAAQFYRTDGPLDNPQDFNRFNLFSKFHTHFNHNAKLTFSMAAFSSAWNASGQIPQRAVNQGLIDRFGAIDNFEGGTTGRQILNMKYEISGARNSQFKIQTYASNYNFKLFSNFTFFLEDSIHGDMIEQTDNRRMLGLNCRYGFTTEISSFLTKHTFGGGFRADDINLSLWKSPERIRLKQLVDSKVAERNFYLWLREEVLFSDHFRMQLGLRADYFTFNVQDRLDNPAVPVSSKLPHASGYSQQALLSPKMNFVYSPLKNLDFYLNSGIGFHSNDARDVVISQKISDMSRSFKQQGYNDAEIAALLRAANFDPAQQSAKSLPAAPGAELGLRTFLFGKLNLGVSAWVLDMQRELVYVGDAGTTELSGATRRVGIDLEMRMLLSSCLWADWDMNFARGRYRNEPDGQNYISLAPEFTSVAGITVSHPNGFEGSIRLRHIGDRPANEDNSVRARGYTLVNAALAYKLNSFTILCMIENILNIEWNEAQFATESRLQNEVFPVTEIHFTPGNPRNVRFGVSYEF